MDSQEILDTLRGTTPVQLSELPDSFGLYALWDHEKNIRYIGCTPKATEGFRIRVANKHVTGSEGRSHKFSQAYCTGRMWRYAKKLHPEAAEKEQNPSDAKLAKKLRTIFIRRFCRVTYIEVPSSPGIADYFSYLTNLESQVQNLAPISMRAWEGIRFESLPEPRLLVDQLLKEMPDFNTAVERQNALYCKHVASCA